MYRDFGTIFSFVLLGIVFVAFALFLQRILAPSRPSPDKQSTYECGEEAEDSAGYSLISAFM